MALFYILLALGVILLHANRIPLVFSMIFEGAFHPQAVTGGVIGSFFTSMKRGVSRGIFSNEAGLGTRFHCPCMCRYQKAGKAGILRHL